MILLMVQAFAADPFLYWPLQDTNATLRHGWHYTAAMGGRCHGGYDIILAGGSDNVLAAADGTVEKVLRGQANTWGDGDTTYDPTSYGNEVRVRHANGLVTIYAHLKTDTIPADLKKGDIVKAGQILGRVNNSGYSKGDHLHFEVRVNNDRNKRVDPSANYDTALSMGDGADHGPAVGTGCPSADEGYLWNESGRNRQPAKLGLEGELSSVAADGMHLTASFVAEAEDGLGRVTLTVGEYSVWSACASGCDATLGDGTWSDQVINTSGRLLEAGDFTVALWVQDADGVAQPVDSWHEPVRFDPGIRGQFDLLEVDDGVLTVIARVEADNGLAVVTLKQIEDSLATIDVEDASALVEFGVPVEWPVGTYEVALWVRDEQDNALPVRIAAVPVVEPGTDLAEQRSVSQSSVFIQADELGDHFGESLASGDVDGDGYDDLLVGASGANPMAAGGGGAYLFYGPLTGVLAAEEADAVVYGVYSEDQAGTSVHAADVNDDGFDDVLVGVESANGGGEDAGAVCVYLGPLAGAHGTDGADFILRGVTDDEVGSSISTGDLDGDGVVDLVVGSLTANGDAGVDTGVVYIAFGLLETGSLADGERWEGPEASGQAGIVEVLGDVDGDGLDDLAIGAHWAEDDAGAVWVLSGADAGYSGVLDDAAVRLSGSGGELGAAVSSVGDVDGDGLADVLAGAPGAKGEGEDGVAWLFVANEPWASFHGDTGAEAGRSVDGGFDVDADGEADLLVGGWGNAGSTWLVLAPQPGTWDLADDADGRFDGVVEGDQAGRASFAGDMDADGHDDVVVGAVNVATSAETTGAVYLLYSLE